MPVGARPPPSDQGVGRYVEFFNGLIGNFTILGAGYVNAAQEAEFEENASGAFSISKV